MIEMTMSDEGWARCQPEPAIVRQTPTDVIDELEQREPSVAYIGPIDDRNQAREWALVLQSQSIGFVLAPLAGAYVLSVAAADHARALAVIDLYETENEDWPPDRHADRPRHPTSIAVPLAFVANVLFFLQATGPASAASEWFSRGRADALALWSEPWRMVTALTLHADAQHVIGNALSGGIFGAMVSRRIGPGGALFAIVLAGGLGNFMNALYHLPEGHRSIGASTAVFAAIGILAAVQTVIDWGRRERRPRFRRMDVVAPLVGGATLLGTLGAGGESTDIYAHLFGFVAGLLVGVVAALYVRRFGDRPSRGFQAAGYAAAAGLVVGAWALALA
jgi:membrane associated rhomboid family serine protease